MVSSADIRNAYIQLYSELRRYVWPYETVELIADLEIAAYTAVPDMAELSTALRSLHSECIEECREDEELAQAFDSLDKLTSDNPQPYLALNIVKEVIT